MKKVECNVYKNIFKRNINYKHISLKPLHIYTDYEHYSLIYITLITGKSFIDLCLQA